MNDTDDKVLQELKSALQRTVKLRELILFGSRARGDAPADSDMDVLVVVDETDGEVEKIVSECAWETSLRHEVLIVPATYSRDEWENGPARSSLLALAIKKEGIAV